jgi:hypothetical protein
MIAAKVALVGLGAFVALSAGGCASAAAPAAPPPAAVKEVSLRSDVLPVFAANCSTTATCHGSPTGIEVFLAGGASKAPEIWSGLVGVATAELPSMPFVTAGDPAKSYLMHKLDGDQASLDAECVDGDCGSQMPRDATPLDAATRETIRNWIAQGALDN